MRVIWVRRSARRLRWRCGGFVRNGSAIFVVFAVSSWVVVTAQWILDGLPSVIQVVPLTSTVRSFRSEVPIEADATNGLVVRSAAQCQHVRAVSTGRVRSVRGTVGPIVLQQVREALALIFDLPA